MTTRTRRGLAAAALCSAGLLVAGAPLIATGTNDKHGGKHGNHPGKKHKKPAYGQPGFKPGKPGSALLFANLKGKNEIDPTSGKKRAGDLDGKGTAMVRVTKSNQVCWGIIVEGISAPTRAHIHQGNKRVNGPIVVAFVEPPATFAPPGTGDPAASAGCVAVDPGLAFDLRKHPHKYYVNVHTGDFPNGALRGQLGNKHRGWWH
jgi:CHRD domain